MANHTIVIQVPDDLDSHDVAGAISAAIEKAGDYSFSADIKVTEYHFEKITADLDEDYEPTDVDLDFPTVESAGVIKGGEVTWFKKPEDRS